MAFQGLVPIFIPQAPEFVNTPTPIRFGPMNRDQSLQTPVGTPQNSIKGLAAILSGRESAIVSKRLNIHLDQKISIAKKYQLVPKTFGQQLKFCKEHNTDRKNLISYIILDQKLNNTPPSYFGKVKKLNSTTKTLHTGRKTFYPEAEAWLYSKFVKYREIYGSILINTDLSLNTVYYCYVKTTWCCMVTS
jgi:hypothetical protein